MNARYILGLDPGLQRTGWGLIRQQDNRLSFLGCGTLRASTKGELSERLHHLNRLLAEVLSRHTIDSVAMEETFMTANGMSTLKLGQARGALLLTCAQAGFTVHEYAATLIKKTVTGAGRAEKTQVAAMVGYLLPGALTHEPDAADALAVAITHAHHASLARLLPA
ncbi:MAG: crossover junction endodeoxyribonuclease RuvC [Alphaproteobacteria bacterium]|nr:crossover junction endodeoxyribonuclease RuvC [Alphaproteobacteria bacterium]